MFTVFMYGADDSASVLSSGGPSESSSTKFASLRVTKHTLKYIAVLYTTGKIPKHDRSYGHASLQKMVNFLHAQGIAQNQVPQILNNCARRAKSMEQWKGKFDLCKSDFVRKPEVVRKPVQKIHIDAPAQDLRTLVLQFENSQTNQELQKIFPKHQVETKIFHENRRQIPSPIEQLSPFID
jgi:hypothetical protein